MPAVVKFPSPRGRATRRHARGRLCRSTHAGSSSPAFFPHCNPLVRRIGSNHRDPGVIDALDSYVGALAHIRRVRWADHLVLAGLIREPIAYMELHREDAALGRRLRIALLLGARLSHLSPAV